ncbi:MAG: response regulator [Opitutaceae bacterium]|jgi:DNA-binding NarL/FixJ family response regulator
MALLVPTSALIIDDEAHVRAYVKLLLGTLGVETFYEASNVEAARRLWAQYHPGLIMLDLNMPGESGLVLLNEVRAEDEETYIVILSSNAQASTVKEAAAAGADGFIRKDSPRDQVIAELTDIFDQPE